MFYLDLPMLTLYICFALSTISTTFVILLGAGLYFKANKKENILPPIKLQSSVDVIVPIYKEEPTLIKKCLDSLIKQTGININLICVVKDANSEQIKLIQSYKDRLSKIKILIQKGKPSQNKAYIAALKNAHSKYVCILNSDAELKENALKKLFLHAYQTDANVSFGLIMPKGSSYFSKFMDIRKLFGQ
jgi:glycosyltransferase involved in cell wall biosynthesis